MFRKMSVFSGNNDRRTPHVALCGTVLSTFSGLGILKNIQELTIPTKEV